MWLAIGEPLSLPVPLYDVLAEIGDADATEAGGVGMEFDDDVVDAGELAVFFDFAWLLFEVIVDEDDA